MKRNENNANERREKVCHQSVNNDELFISLNSINNREIPLANIEKATKIKVLCSVSIFSTVPRF